MFLGERNLRRNYEIGNFYRSPLVSSGKAVGGSSPCLIVGKDRRCDDGFSKFNARQNCHYIKTDADVADNWLCAVLCERPEYVYTNSGVCSVDGYCMNGDSKMRLHVARPDGEKYSYPLYASKTSSPALHFKFLDKVTNAEKMCYVNLVPPDAIAHFVTTKPNPIRVGKTFTWFDSAGEEHTATNLITID